MPMGPFRLTDLVGGDIGLHVAQSYVRDFSERVYQSRLIPLMNDAKRLGEKTGSGFYSFAAGRGKAKRDAAGIAPFLNKSRSLAGLAPECARAVASMSAEEIVEVVMFPVVNEACRVLHEGIVDSAGDLDVCTVLGMGFPPYRYARSLPVDNIKHSKAPLIDRHVGILCLCNTLRDRPTRLALVRGPHAASLRV